MPPFAFDCAKAERSIRDPDGALWPVNAYSDADELNGLVQAAIESEAITRPNKRAHFYIYPLSLSGPDPVLVCDPGHGRAFLGFSLKLREREGESPAEFTLRLLDDLTAEANGLAGSGCADCPATAQGSAEEMNLLCPHCCSEVAALTDRGRRLECGNCGAPFAREEALVIAVDALQRVGGTHLRPVGRREAIEGEQIFLGFPQRRGDHPALSGPAVAEHVAAEVNRAALPSDRRGRGP